MIYVNVALVWNTCESSCMLLSGASSLGQWPCREALLVIQQSVSRIRKSQVAALRSILLLGKWPWEESWVFLLGRVELHLVSPFFFFFFFCVCVCVWYASRICGTDPQLTQYYNHLNVTEILSLQHYATTLLMNDYQVTSLWQTWHTTQIRIRVYLLLQFQYSIVYSYELCQRSFGMKHMWV